MHTPSLVGGSEPRGFNFEVDHDYFKRAVWPAAAGRANAEPGIQ
jgi:hypothetical protein